MFQLILAVIAIGLFASLALVTVNYLPTWAPAAQETADLTRTGAKTLAAAFDLRAADPAGGVPDENSSLSDGGLAAAFQPYYSFLPRAPQGYAWKYGQTTQLQLEADGYAGNSTGGLHWFCLYPAGAGGSLGTYKGFKRAQRVFPETQVYVNSGGSAFCGRALNSPDPASFPSPVAVTMFVRYVEGNP
jgi:hypothetical protein